MSYIGDFKLGTTFDLKFTTAAAGTGVPTTLTGGVVAAYPDNSTTEITAGITLTLDFDSRTGMHNVRIVATTGNGYATGVNYSVVITTGTVGGNSAVGYVVGEFSIEARVINFASINLPVGPVTALNWAEGGTMQAGSTGSSAVLRAATSFADSILVGATIMIYGGTGIGQSRLITAFVGATDTATVTPNWTTTPDNTSVYAIIGTAQSSGGSAPTAAQNAAAVWDEARASHVAAGSFGQGVATVQGNVTGSVASVTGAVGSVTGAVGSVSGNLGGNVIGNVNGNVVGSTGSVVGIVTANTIRINGVTVQGTGIALDLWRG